MRQVIVLPLLAILFLVSGAEARCCPSKPLFALGGGVCYPDGSPWGTPASGTVQVVSLMDFTMMTAAQYDPGHVDCFGKDPNTGGFPWVTTKKYKTTKPVYYTTAGAQDFVNIEADTKTATRLVPKNSKPLPHVCLRDADSNNPQIVSIGTGPISIREDNTVVICGYLTNPEVNTNFFTGPQQPPVMNFVAWRPGGKSSLDAAAKRVLGVAVYGGRTQAKTNFNNIMNRIGQYCDIIKTDGNYGSALGLSYPCKLTAY